MGNSLYFEIFPNKLGIKYMLAYSARLLLSVPAGRIKTINNEIQQNEHYGISANMLSGMPIVNLVANGPPAGRPDIESKPHFGGQSDS